MAAMKVEVLAALWDIAEGRGSREVPRAALLELLRERDDLAVENKALRERCEKLQLMYETHATLLSDIF